MSFSRPATTGRVVVDHAIHDRVQDRHAAAPQQVRPGLQLARTSPRSGASLWRTVITKPRAGEDVHLAELDGLRLVDVAGRAQHAEQRVAVALELGPLMCVDRVLDRELVQGELARDLGELLAARAVEPDPRDAAASRYS